MKIFEIIFVTTVFNHKGCKRKVNIYKETWTNNGPGHLENTQTYKKMSPLLLSTHISHPSKTGLCTIL